MFNLNAIVLISVRKMGWIQLVSLVVISLIDVFIAGEDDLHPLNSLDRSTLRIWTGHLVITI